MYRSISNLKKACGNDKVYQGVIDKIIGPMTIGELSKIMDQVEEEDEQLHDELLFNAWDDAVERLNKAFQELDPIPCPTLAYQDAYDKMIDSISEFVTAHYG